MEPQELVDYLSQIGKETGLIEKAKQSCMETIRTYSEDLSDTPHGHYTNDELILEFDYQSLVFNHHFGIHPYIKTRIGIFVNDTDQNWIDNLKPIGFFECESDFEGKELDNFLVLDRSK